MQEKSLFTLLGAAIVQRNSEIIENLDLQESRLVELKRVWKRLEPILSPHDRTWFYSVLAKKPLPFLSPVAIEVDAVRLIRVKALGVNNNDACSEYIVRQTDGTEALPWNAVPLAVGLEFEERREKLAKRYLPQNQLALSPVLCKN